MDGPYFFFSYTRRDADAALYRFYHDLSERVRHHASLSGGEAGFRDQASIEVGERWSRALGDALRTCRAFVAVYSPGYFESEYCGKEWTAFRSRFEDRLGADDEPPPLIVPVFWESRDELTLPPVASEVQYHQESLPEVYVEKGLLHLLENPKLLKEYERVVDELARKMVEAAEKHVLLPYRLTFDFGKIPSAFGDGGTRAGRRERMLREHFEGYLRALWERLNPLPHQQVTGKGSEKESIPSRPFIRRSIPRRRWPWMSAIRKSISLSKPVIVLASWSARGPRPSWQASISGNRAGRFDAPSALSRRLRARPGSSFSERRGAGRAPSRDISR